MKAIVLLSTAALFVSLSVAQQKVLPQLPEPSAPAAKSSQIVPRPDGALPKAPAGFTVDLYADNLPNARLMEFAPNGDLFVSQPSQNAVTVLRDTNNDGIPDVRTVFAHGAPRGRGTPPAGTAATAATAGELMLQPFGLAFHDGYLYVGNTNSIVRYKYQPGDTEARSEAEKLADLPGGGDHSTRNILFSRDGKKMYVSIGSAGNINEGGDEVRAAINEYNPDGSGHRIFASGIRNPVGLAWLPGTNTLWTAVNERDNLGDDLVPDYATSVKDGGFYGWPYSYIGSHVDIRVPQKHPELVARAIVPDILIPAHSAALGLAFYSGSQFPQRYRNGLFVALHGSWNRSKANGYKIVFIPFQNGKPSGPIEDFVTGFLISDGSKGPDDPIRTWGRPVGVTFTRDGALLISDDAPGRIWRVRYTGGK